VAANVAYGPVGALVSAWPAVGFIGSVELLMLLVRRSRMLAVPTDGDVTGEGNGLPGYIYDAQRVYADQIAAGEVPAIRQIRSDMGVGSHRAQQVRAHIEALATAPSG
jgi:hypothetical protein